MNTTRLQFQTNTRADGPHDAPGEVAWAMFPQRAENTASPDRESISPDVAALLGEPEDEAPEFRVISGPSVSCGGSGRGGCSLPWSPPW